MELIGNKGVMKQLSIVRDACKATDNALPHMLLSGAPGCGKTSTARHLAKHTGAHFMSVTPESFKERNDVVRILEQFERKIGYDDYGNRIKNVPTSYPILFVDEIHRMPLKGQELLGIAMEEWKLPIEAAKAKVNIYDKFGSSKVNRERWFPRFTVVGATTNDGLLSKPFKDRFKLRFIFNTYTEEESRAIVKIHATRLNIEIDDAGTNEIAKRGRGVPRIIVTLLERCRDLAVAQGETHISGNLAKAAFLIMNIDVNGLNETDIKILKALYASETPLGVDNLAILTNESRQSIAETIEPYLIQQELMVRTGKGRVITDKGRIYLINSGHIEPTHDWVDIPTDYVRSL